MATRLTVTIDQGAAGKDGETRRAELAQAIEADSTAMVPLLGLVRITVSQEGQAT